MSLTEKLKGINKKWYILAVVVLIIIVGGCTAARISYLKHYRTLTASQVSAQVFRQVELDLLYLEKLPNLKVTPEQAKEMLPLVEQMAVPETTATADLAKQVYGLLTPVQYEALANRTGYAYRYPGGRERDREHGNGLYNEREHGFWKGNNSIQNPREEALGGVVVKLLKDRAAEKPVVEKTTPATPAPVQPSTTGAPGGSGGNKSQ